jgi:hypothetical protein
MTVIINSQKKNEESFSRTHVTLQSFQNNNDSQRGEAYYKELNWKLIRFQNAYSPSKSMRLCNRVPLQLDNGSMEVTIAKGEGTKARYLNLMNCKSALCAHCSDPYRKPHRTKAKSGISNALRAKYITKMITFTIPRAFGNDNYIEKYKALSSVFSGVCSRLRKILKGRGINLYTMRGFDATVDSQRFDPLHIHIHSLIVMDKSFKGFEDWVWRTYERLMRKRGLEVSRKGFDVKDIFSNEEITDYIVKSLGQIEREITSTNKDGKAKNSKGYWKWLCSIVDNPTAKDILIYQNIIKASKGKRQHDFSHNWNELEDLFTGPAEEKSELKVVDSDRDGLTLTKDDNEGVTENDLHLWSLNHYLWEAIKELKVEDFVLSIIDEWFDNGVMEGRYKFFDRLANMNLVSLVGEHKKIFYSQQLQLLLYWIDDNHHKGEINGKVIY